MVKEINKQAKKHDRIIDCLLQIKIAEEDSKFGMTAEEASQIIQSDNFHELETKLVNCIPLTDYIHCKYNKIVSPPLFGK